MQQLLNEEPDITTNAAQVRVTPQELAQATAAIEARQNAIAQHKAATIPIGEAVQQLNLETTPEEVLVEVEAQRRAQTQTQTGTQRKTLPKAARILIALVCVQGAIMAWLGWRLTAANRMNIALRHQTSADYARIQALEQTVQSQAAELEKLKHPVEAMTRPISLELLKSDQFRDLDIDEGQTVRCNYDALQALAKGELPKNVFTLKKPATAAWEITRERGYFFVKCWTSITYAEKLVNGHEGVVYPTKAGALDERADSQIKLPIESFQGAAVHATMNDAPVAVVINNGAP